MQISPEVLKNIRKIVFLEYEPNDRTVMWAKPDGSGQFMFLVYNNGAWQQVSEDEGVIINISDISGNLSTFNNDAGFITEDDIGDVIEGASAGATALQPSDIPSWAKQSSKPSYTASEVGALPDTTKYAGSQSVGGAANKAMSIPKGVVDNTSTTLAVNATVDGINELRDGVLCYIQNDYINAAGGFTLNVNNLGAKYVYTTLSTAAKISTQFTKTTTMLFVYNANRIEGGCWDMFFGVDTDLNDAAYRIRAINGGRIAFNTIKANILLLSRDSKYVIAVNESGSTGTNKTLTTESFDPFGQIWVYTNGTIDIAPEGNVPNGYLWCQVGQHDARRSFNISTTEFEVRKDVYLVAVPQSDGSAKLHSSPITQTLPSTEDGLIYIYLGIANQAYQFDLYLKHPIYYFKEGAIRQWTNQDTTALKLGTSTVGGTTQGIYLNQGVPAACQDFETMYIRYIASLYGAVRNEQTGLWSYYYTDCARYDTTQEKIVWDRSIGYDDITDAEIKDMVNYRIEYLRGFYGRGYNNQSRIGFHIIGYGNNSSIDGASYINNQYIQTYGYVGNRNGGKGPQYAPYVSADTQLLGNLKHLIGQGNSSGDFTVDSRATKLEYITIGPRKNNHKINYGVCPNIEFVSVYYTVVTGDTYTGCQLTLHPDVYAKIFDSTNADYALWHKIDLANQARTNPITIQSA